MIVSTGRIIVRADMGAELGLMVLENRVLTSKEQQDPEESYALRTSLTCTRYILIRQTHEDEETGIYRACVSRKRNSNISTGISGRKNSFEKLSVDGKIILKCFLKQVAECPQVVTFPEAFFCRCLPGSILKAIIAFFCLSRGIMCLDCKAFFRPRWL